MERKVSLMFPVLVLLLLSYVLQPALSSSVQALERLFQHTTDRDTLLAFKSSLSNQQDVLAAWNTTSDFCRWPGVVCGAKHKDRVTVLNLSSEGLVGPIIPSIGNLTFLKILDLSLNHLRGEIPSQIGRLSRLRYLDLSNNSLHGDMNAGLKNCTSLQSINLGSNLLTGEIPSWLGGLSSLRTIILQKSNFTGIIPPSLANLSALQKIHLRSNQLESSIPEGLGRLGKLFYIDLGENHLSGTIPTTFYNLSSLTRFRVTNNELHGTLPSNLGDHLPNLEYLLLGINNFTGSLPASLVNATNIYSLDISFNNFTGIVPPDIGKLCPDFLSLETNQLMAATAHDWKFVTFLANCTRLRLFDLQYNKLGGVLPISVTNLSSQLQILCVNHNEISGKIPSGLSNLGGLNYLQLSHNRFTGILPDSIGHLSSLQALAFNGNRLTGFIPSSLGNLTKLLELYSGENKFEGPLPTSLGRLRELTIATFDNNKFTGPLPKEIFNLSSLSYALDLSNNNFVGPLPPEVGFLTKVAYIYIHWNNLQGPLPNTLSNCQSLIGLRLHHNSFNGSIPAAISKMRGLILLSLAENTLSGVIPQELGLMGGIEAMYLAFNKLSGQIPEDMENMTSIYHLDLSFNHLVGKVPLQGVFSNVTGFLFYGNSGLCGGISELRLPACPPESTEHSLRIHHVLLAIVIPVVVGIIICCSLALVFFTIRRKQRAQSTSMRGFILVDGNYPRVSYAELLQATSCFAADNLIGKGRYGSVYKCELLLKNMMTTVAVKVFELQQSGSSKSFLAECEALSNIRHQNLISVITCCSSSDSNQNDFKAIVFEFMPNGSLDRWLHQDVHATQQLQGLTLMQRLNIVVDVADALDYLHNCEPPIVHCDLKPSNILLDSDLLARIGDFGLAKILLDPAAEQQINSKSSVGIRGTIGYLAPEYGEGGQVSTSGDVYSFGSVILELFTGMAPTHNMFKDGLTLQKYAKNAFPDMLMKIVDPALLSFEEVYVRSLQGGSYKMEDVSNTMFSIMEVAVSCCKQASAERMCMRDAAARMHKIRDNHVERRQSEHVIITA
ncbi:probable LRR receptor-like serine/threonine-protein kinase At3g47570 [Triticum urartu]|uniref:probable LRR receptor-like serine/threonine-protein kinase At3g47570 n=1 Tax=Triticum urartu TaxID=4572 RepID=UPI0020433192|nr:probable LRR receptor-like serine/threonine-protein kinase At3g47570 [Triticum urartu]